MKKIEQKSKKPYLLLLTANLLREIISFLTYVEFIDVSLACKRLFKFLDDMYLKFPLVTPSILYNEESWIKRPILERKFIESLDQNMMPAVHVE